MGCTIAMALLGLCSFSFAGEPISPLAGDGDRRSPSMEYIDRRAGGVPRYSPADEPFVVQPAPRRGRIAVRPRG